VNDIAAQYAGWLGLVAVQRIGELLMSRRNIRASRRREEARAAGTSLDWSAMVAVHAALIALPAIEFFFLQHAESTRRWLFWSCFGAFACAQAIRYWALHALGRAWNARALVDPHLGVVTQGPYRWIRHPNYLAVLVEFSAIPLAVGAWRSWIVLNAFHTLVLIRRIRAEETLLAAVPGYSAAMRDKPRFVPFRRGRTTRIDPRAP
jgi:methyltransferase